MIRLNEIISNKLTISLYHCTPKENVDDIKKNGLLMNKIIEGEEGNWFSSEPNLVYGNSCFVCEFPIDELVKIWDMDLFGKNTEEWKNMDEEDKEDWLWDMNENYGLQICIPYNISPKKLKLIKENKND